MKRFIKFGIVGVVNTGITVFAFYLLNQVLGIYYIVSSVLGYTLGIINSYILNKKWTFRDNGKSIIKQFSSFVGVNLVSMLVNLIVIYVCVEYFNLDKMAAQITAIAFSISINYFGSKTLVFVSTVNSQQ